MNTWIALFRGINVGGNNLVPMKELVEALEKAGCSDVKTYIQSGNAVFRSAVADAKRMSARVRKAVASRFGFDPHVVVISRKELARAAAANPFPEAEAVPKALHLFFLVEAPRSRDLKSLESLKSPGDAFALKGNVFYLYTPNGIARSKVAERFGRCVGVESTARNWRTVCKLLELAKSSES